jgi:hypothetical protein
LFFDVAGLTGFDVAGLALDVVGLTGFDVAGLALDVAGLTGFDVAGLALDAAGAPPLPVGASGTDRVAVVVRARTGTCRCCPCFGPTPTFPFPSGRLASDDGFEPADAV